MSQLGVGVRGAFQPTVLAEAAALIERAGFDVISVFGDLGFQPPIPALLIAAERTHRVRLGPACLNPYTMHPVEIAGHIAYLDQLSGGRAFVGIARGAWLQRIGLDQPDPLAAMRDSAEIVRRLLAGNVSGYEGKAFKIDRGFHLISRGRQERVPLLLGGWGPRSIALAGELADEIKIGGTANPRLVPWVRRQLHAGAVRTLGRAPDATRIVTGAVTVVDRDGTRARARARTEVAMYVDVVGALDPTITVERELLDRIHQLLEQGAAERAGRLIPDDLLDGFALAGTPNTVVRRITELMNAGVARVELGPPLGVDGLAAGIDLLGKTVVPEFR